MATSTIPISGASGPREESQPSRQPTTSQDEAGVPPYETTGSSEGITCPTILLHEPDSINDYLIHYLGCIDISEREGFLNQSHPAWRHARGDVDARIGNLAVAIDMYYRRTSVLRNALKKGRPHLGFFRTGVSLVDHVERSHMAWLKSKTYKDGIKDVQSWRHGKGKICSEESARGELRLSEPERTKASEIAKHHREDIAMKGKGKGAIRRPKEEEENQEYRLETDVNAYIFHYKTSNIPNSSGERHGHSSFDGETLNDTRLRGVWPYQHTALSTLLDPENRELLEVQNGDLRYIHIPSNNMDVSTSITRC